MSTDTRDVFLPGRRNSKRALESDFDVECDNEDCDVLDADNSFGTEKLLITFKPP